MIDSAKYTVSGTIIAIIDGKQVSVPDDPSNRHRRMIAEWEASGGVIQPYQTPAPTAADVNAERDRRIADGFMFNGVQYQSGPEDRENIAGAATAALGAIMNGAQPGDYHWHGGSSDFVWIAADNTEHAMDAQTVYAFGQAALAHKQAHIFAARALKDSDPIPADYADDQYWP
ncbi:DUF4376 domain-containing protein [Oricola thermophila]|uniref:DUF4376 domain-containing protein n=1 Tax=Oricola thermophila TaxID=2742145 RepID=A0A6N1VE35_9HYPH|nr:DUF4376 domain-containing protein [Oricola thermophila]QKV17865.1 DUF4376 domain-containing protein [Oricola thermophila]